MVVFRSQRTPLYHSGRKIPNLEAKPAQEIGKKYIAFIAKSPSFSGYDLLVNAFCAKADPTTEMNIKILEGDL
jgi:hypothetical protein